jgi:cation diffusion facilitator family transporter
MFAGILIIAEGSSALFSGGELKELNVGMILVLIAGTINGILGLFLKYVGKKYNSKALSASGTHVMSDCLTSIGIIVGLIIVKFSGLYWPDPVVAILLGTVLSYQGLNILKDSGKDLMDGEDQGVIKELAILLKKHMFPGIINFHYMRVIRAGRFHHINIHVDVPDFWSVEKAHEESERFEELVINEYTFDGEIHFHLDPCRKKHCTICELSECEIRQENFSGHISDLNIETLTSPTGEAK